MIEALKQSVMSDEQTPESVKSSDRELENAFMLLDSYSEKYCDA